MFWTSISDVSLVGLETEDDVVANLSQEGGHKEIREQAKHTIADNVPFQDRSVDLWKTLSIWIANINSVDDLDGIQYSMVANKPLYSNRIIKKLTSTEGQEFEKNVKALIEIAESASDQIKPYADIVLRKNEDILKALLKRVQILEMEESVNRRDIKNHVRKNLGIGSDLPIEEIYNGLLGFITDSIITKWRSGKEFIIDREDLIKESNRLIVKYKDKSFIEKTSDSLPVTKKEIDNEQRSAFVEQLRVISCKDAELFAAIKNFIRAESEKTRFAREGNVLRSSYNEYYEELKQKWQSVYNYKSRMSQSNMSNEDIGYDIFYSTKEFKGKLNGQIPEQNYTHEGAYHYLANQLEIGWNPDWEEIFRKVVSHNGS